MCRGALLAEVRQSRRVQAQCPLFHASARHKGGHEQLGWLCAACRDEGVQLMLDGGSLERRRMSGGALSEGGGNAPGSGGRTSARHRRNLRVRQDTARCRGPAPIDKKGAPSLVWARIGPKRHHRADLALGSCLKIGMCRPTLAGAWQDDTLQKPGCMGNQGSLRFSSARCLDPLGQSGFRYR